MKLFVFGSILTDRFNVDSDVNMVVDFDKVTLEDYADNYFEDTPLLWKLGRKVSYFIEPVLLSENENSPLYADVIKTGILI